MDFLVNVSVEAAMDPASDLLVDQNRNVRLTILGDVIDFNRESIVYRLQTTPPVSLE